MRTRRLIMLAFWLNCVVVNATAETTVFRPGPCASQAGAYLLASNSGALIRVTPDSQGAATDHVIVFKKQKSMEGWASQRLLRRFDLQLEEGGPRIINSGAFCRGGK
jgi:hypothetical protein